MSMNLNCCFWQSTFLFSTHSMGKCGSNCKIFKTGDQMQQIDQPQTELTCLRRAND